MGRYESHIKPYAHPADLTAFDSIIREFGAIVPDDPKERARQDEVIGRFLASLPRITLNGGSYAPSYSYGVHLRALREDRDGGGTRVETWTDI